MSNLKYLVSKKTKIKKGLKWRHILDKTIFLKVFVNYLQILSLSEGFDLKWPEELLSIFRIEGQIVQFAQQIFALDCFLSGKTIFFIYKI